MYYQEELKENIRVWVDEEYGYDEYVWTSPFTTQEQIFTWWDELDKRKIERAVFAHVPPAYTREEYTIKNYTETFGGEWERVKNLDPTYRDQLISECSHCMHIHQEDDSTFNEMFVR